MTKIIVVEDHHVVRNGIRLLLDAQDNLEVIGEANNGNELLGLLEKGLLPNVVLSDIDMEGMNGMQLLTALKNRFPEIKVIILSMLNTKQHIVEAFDRGADGYLVKNVGYDEWLYAIQHVVNGGKYLCADMAMTFVQQSSDVNMNQQVSSTLKADLSERELEILQLISEGYTNVEIADRLFLSKRTVEGHRQNLIDKTGARNSAALIKLAVRNGLVD